MPIAYVLLNCSLGSEEKVIEELKQIESVKEVNGTFGTYDILAKLETSNIEELRKGLSHQIRKIDKVTGTLTLMGIDGQD
jgi:DNA-binding Lrp family transcriptional regulator